MSGDRDGWDSWGRPGLIHADGTHCWHGLAEPGEDQPRPAGPPPRCAGGQDLAGYRLDPDEPAP